MIVRSWAGRTRSTDAHRYVDYLLKTGVRQIRATPGNEGVMVLRRTLGDETEFVVQSSWRSLDDIKAFAGDDIDQAIFYPEDDSFMVAKDLTVTHHEVAVRA